MGCPGGKMSPGTIKMTGSGNDFLARLERKVREQLRGQRVGYLLGAGASYLNEQGYPLAGQLWRRICDTIDPTHRQEIQQKLDNGADGLEAALDLLDSGEPGGSPHRHSVTDAIARHFIELSPPLDMHAQFVERLSRRRELSIPVFCLNYDPLLERASERAKVRLIDGFIGIEQAYFAPSVFQETFAVVRRGRTARRQTQLKLGILHLFKLHGSLGWYENPAYRVRRIGFSLDVPPGAKRLMVPPQYRKATDTTAPPYSSLWSEFRRLIRHGPDPINRLVCIGYGLRDHHVNDVIENGLARGDFTVLVFARTLPPEVFDRWSPKANMILVTRQKCALYSEIGDGHPDLWDFQRLSKEI